MKLIASGKTCGWKSPSLKQSGLGDIPACTLPTQLIDGEVNQQQRLLERKTIPQSYLLCSNLYLSLEEDRNRPHAWDEKSSCGQGGVGINGRGTWKMLPGQSKPQKTSAQLLGFPLFPVQKAFSFSALLKYLSLWICLSDLCLLQRCPHTRGGTDLCILNLPRPALPQHVLGARISVLCCVLSSSMLSPQTVTHTQGTKLGPQRVSLVTTSFSVF